MGFLMEIHSKFFPIVISVLFWLLLSCSLCYGVQSDIDCLRSIKDSLQDPYGYLNSTWNFNNNTEGFICRFTGVECWHPDESKVLNIRLSDMDLKGRFPRGLKNCTSLTGLVLSNNKLFGPIPADIDSILHFATSLDLSSNNFSGEIPVALANVTYLNVLNLDNNRFTGMIPPVLGLLSRLKTFSVADNLLTGPIPKFQNVIPADSFANNSGLCGKPLDPCPAVSTSANSGIIAGAAAGGVIVAAVGVTVGLYFYYRRMSRKRKKVDDPEGNRWAKKLKKSKGVKVSLFENSVSKMRLSDLMKATSEFTKNNIIGTGRTGNLYKGVLEDGTALMVKRLQDSQHSEKEFLSEMATLGSVRHKHLVPLLGYCVAEKERLLVYRYMAKGTLHEHLHRVDDGGCDMDWALRLKIGIGAAKGFAWLHHNCNPRIIHRNISSKCILLDADFEPKISDFGLARLMNPIDTHLSTFVNGEFGDLGYVAPEYMRTLVATPKGDVYSLGVVLLELVTGERPTYVTKAPETFKGNLVEWITELSTTGKLESAIDNSLVGKGVDNELFQFLKVACRCVLPEIPKERPSMFELYQLLRTIGEHYNFSADDDLMMPTDSGDADTLEELIVNREVGD